MSEVNNKEFTLYNDIKARTGGEIYIGVVGPVRTGKSTFIKRFMDLEVIPQIDDENLKERTIDELPQSGNGKIIMTTEPKFIPKEAADINIGNGVQLKIKFIDCVGYIVEGAEGTKGDDNKDRMVKTPWFDYDIPFAEAAKIGTEKVINNHSTIGMVVTTDGSIGELPRENYIDAENKTINELKKIGKPFIVLVNSTKPHSKEAKDVVSEIENLHNVTAVAINCQQLRKEDIYDILEKILYEFYITQIHFYMPKWVETLSNEHPIKQCMIKFAKEYIKDIEKIKDVFAKGFDNEGEFINKVKLEKVDMATGIVTLRIDVDDKYYYENISELTGVEISGEYQLIAMIKELANMRKEYNKVSDAMNTVRQKGYSVVTPDLDEIVLEEPSLIKHGNKYGVKIKAQSPSIHMIKANIETEIAPIVGSESQANDLIEYIKQSRETPEGIWQTNIFGKTIEDLVGDGINNKISMMTDDSQLKLQDTMQKVVNDNTGGMVCIII